MEILTQYQLNYVATFIPQYERGILNFICNKFNNPKLKVSIWGIKNDERLSKWYCSYFKFKYVDFMNTGSEFQYYDRINENHYHSNKVKILIWAVKNDSYFDFIIISNKIVKYCDHNSYVIKNDIKMLIRKIINLNSAKYLKLILKLLYTTGEEYKILLFLGFRNRNFDQYERFGLIPHCLLCKYTNILNYILKIIPKKYLICVSGMYSSWHQNIDFFDKGRRISIIHCGCRSIKNYYGFLKKHKLIMTKNNS